MEGKAVALKLKGQLEQAVTHAEWAAKFVGPLTAPVSGTIRGHNSEVLARPDLVNQDPMAHWLVEIELAEGEEELTLLLRDPELVRAWFEIEIQRFQEKGMIAE